MRQRVEENVIAAWVRSRMTPAPIETVPRRLVIAVVSVSVVFGDLLLVSLAAVTWNILANARNRFAMSVETGGLESAC